MKRSLSIALLVCSVLFLSAEASAQVADEISNVITIEPGRVLLNGELVPENELPKSLNLSNITASMTLMGNSLIEVNGFMYRIVDGKIIEAQEHDSGTYEVRVYFNDPAAPQQPVRVLNTPTGDAAFFSASDGPYEVVLQNYVNKLNDKAVEFDRIRSRIVEENHDEAMGYARLLKIEAENTARIAGAFPRVEYEGYLQGIHKTDAPLYGRLVREHEMEMNTHQLAMQARMATDPKERSKYVAELRDQLETIFELKQKNREDEIAQLSERLNDLTELMDKRAAMQDRIVESRLKELLGNLNW